MAEISDTIEQTALDGVQRASVDGRSVDAVPIPDQIEADKYLTAKAAVDGTNANGGPKSAWGKLRMGRAVPPGAI